MAEMAVFSLVAGQAKNKREVKISDIRKEDEGFFKNHFQS